MGAALLILENLLRLAVFANLILVTVSCRIFTISASARFQDEIVRTNPVEVVDIARERVG